MIALLAVVRCGGEQPAGPAGESGAGVLWSRPIDARLDASVEVLAGRVVTSDGSDVIGLDVEDGSESWRVQIDRFGPFPARIDADGEVVYAFQGATSAALSASNGTVLWKREGPAGETPLVHGGRIYGVGRGFVTARDRTGGAVEWTTDLGTPRDGLLAAAGDDLCVVTRLLVIGPAPPEEVLCLDAASGDIRWRFDDDRLVAPPGLVVRDGRAIVGTSDGWILAIDLETGSLAWELELSAPLVSGLAASGERIVACTSDRGPPACVAVRARDGAVLWTTPIEGAGLGSAPVIADGAVWLVERGALAALDLATGARVFGPVTPEESIPFFAGTPAVSDGVAYVLSFERLYAVSTRE